jgi:hypothetical protein
MGPNVAVFERPYAASQPRSSSPGVSQVAPKAEVEQMTAKFQAHMAEVRAQQGGALAAGTLAANERKQGLVAHGLIKPVPVQQYFTPLPLVPPLPAMTVPAGWFHMNPDCSYHLQPAGASSEDWLLDGLEHTPIAIESLSMQKYLAALPPYKGSLLPAVPTAFSYTGSRGGQLSGSAALLFSRAVLRGSRKVRRRFRGRSSCGCGEHQLCSVVASLHCGIACLGSS